MNLEKFSTKSVRLHVGNLAVFGDFKDEIKIFLLYDQYLTLISHHVKGDPQKALLNAADLQYRQVPKTTASAPSLRK